MGSHLFQMQLRHERTEERRKLFKIAEKGRNVIETPLTRWKKILPALPQVRTGIPRNAEVTQRDDVQITIGDLNDTVERERLTTDIEQDSLRQDQISDCNNGKHKEEENDLQVNDTTSNKRYVVSIIKTRRSFFIHNFSVFIE